MTGILLAAAVMAAPPQYPTPAPFPPAAWTPPVVQATERAAAVRVDRDGGGGTRLGGSGVCVWSEDGRAAVLTCDHLFAGYPADVTVTAGDKTYPGVAVGGDPATDTAVVVLEVALPVAEVADPPAAGQVVRHYGRASGYSAGTAGEAFGTAFTAAMPVTFGDSGAGVFDANGKLVAVTFGRADGGRLFATPVRTAFAALLERTRERALFSHLLRRLPKPVEAVPAPAAKSPPPAAFTPPPATLPKLAPADTRKVPVPPAAASPCPGGVCPPPALPMQGRRGLFGWRY